MNQVYTTMGVKSIKTGSRRRVKRGVKAVSHLVVGIGALVLLLAIPLGARAQGSASTTTSGLDAFWNVATTPDQRQAILSLNQTAVPVPTASINEVILQQNGTGNQAMLSIVAGSQNRIEASQFNNNNLATTVLSGTNNSLLMTQTGGNNTLDLGLTGANNRLMVSQDGGDRAVLQGLQRDNTRLELIQGSGNNTFITDNTSLLKDPASTGVANLRIEQTGGATVRIQTGHIIGQ